MTGVSRSRSTSGRKVARVVACLPAIALFALPASARAIDFAHEVVPILRKHCGQCHTGDARQGGFSMNTREATLAGGDSATPGFVEGKAAASEIVRRVESDDPDERMPSEGDPLPAEAVAILKRWIDEKAPWEEGFSFKGSAWEPPLALRAVELPAARDGRTNPVDRIVDASWQEHGVARPPRCDDRTFIRRASLDLVGLLPDPDRVERFVAEGDPGKRARLVRELLADDVTYAEHWMTFWNDLLRNDYTGTGFITGGRKQITPWLHRSLVENKPFDAFVRELIAPTDESRGFIDGIVWRGEVNSSQTVPIQFAQNVGQTFLGINLKCASCHDSFVDRWTLKQTYDLAAIYSEKPLELHRCDKATGVKAEPAWLFGEIGQVNAKAAKNERLSQLATIMTKPENGWLSRSLVNRLWHRLMGRGIVHPVDSLRTKPWSEDLLEFLAGDLVSHDFDVKHVLETICTSEAYAAATPAVEGQPQGSDYVFKGPLPRRLTAEQFTDAVWQLTNAAPAKGDAQVVRVKPSPDAHSPDTKPPAPPSALWVWSNAQATSPAGEKLAFRKSFTLSSPAVHATIVAAADNELVVYLNGRKVASSNDWQAPASELVSADVKAGDNRLLVVAANGAAGGPAGVRVELRARLANGSDTTISTDDSWEWSASVPNDKGQYPKENPSQKEKVTDDWKPAAVAADQGTWSAGAAVFSEKVAAGTVTGPVPMVRAVLVKSTPLMAALGRPNRDQVVTSRPSDLTTLEAIQLANEQGLFDQFTRGAAAMLADAGKEAGSPDADIMIRRMFASALSRPPTADEAAAAREILGEKPTRETVADCLWAVVMLPEFQLVR